MTISWDELSGEVSSNESGAPGKVLDIHDPHLDCKRTPADAAALLLAIRDKIAFLKEREKVLSAVVASDFPEEPHEETRTYAAYGENFEVTSKVGEVMDWDSDTLSSLFAGAARPPYVTEKLTIPQKEYNALSDADRTFVAPALTRKPGRKSIKIKKV